MNSLTEAQKRRIEENKKVALARRAAKQSLQLNTEKPPNTSKTCSLFSSGSFYKNSLVSQSKKSINFCQSNSPKSKQTGSPNTLTSFVKTTNGNCYLISKERFSVKIAYNQQVIDLFKTVPSRHVSAPSSENLLTAKSLPKDSAGTLKHIKTCNKDPLSRNWNFLLKDHDNLLSALSFLKPSVIIGSLPNFILKALKSRDVDDSKVDLSLLNPHLLETLLPFQLDGVRFGISQNGRILLADDMGLGKTIQAIAIVSYYRSEWPLLVVTPASMRYAWGEALNLWLGLVLDREVSVIDTSKDSMDNVLVAILTYDLLAKRAAEVQALNFKVVILDESHMIKGFKTARYKAVSPIMKGAKRVLLLSGTPALSRPSELYTQISGIDPKLFPNFQDFGLRYCDGKQQPWGWDFSGSSNLEELQIVLEARIMLRRLKSNVISQLPSKRRVTVTLDPALIKLSSSSFNEAAKHFGLSNLKGSEKHCALLQFFAETAHVKLKAIGEHIKSLIEEEKKFLVYAHHRIVLDMLCSTCENCKCRYIRIDGRTNGEDRQQLVEMFQVDESIRVAVLSVTAANTGITLTAANLVVFGELFWNPGILIQAEDRAHRIGQQDCVVVQYLIAKGTADDHIWPLIQSKLDVLGKAGLSKDTFMDNDFAMQQESFEESILNYFPLQTPSDETTLSIKRIKLSL